MTMSPIRIAAVVGLCALGSVSLTLIPASAADGNEPAALRQVATIDLPGPRGERFDYLTIDRGGNRLFSAHLGASQTYVIDLAANKVLNVIRDTPGVEGLAYVADEGKLYTSNAYDNTVGVVDLKTMTVVRKIPT